MSPPLSICLGLGIASGGASAPVPTFSSILGAAMKLYLDTRLGVTQSTVNLSGTFAVTNGLTTVGTTVNQVGTVAVGDVVYFSPQPTVPYVIASVGAATLTLPAGGYSGTTNAAATATDIYASSLADQSGNGSDASAAGAARPPYNATGGANGLPKLTFNLTQKMTGSVSPIASGAARTVYAVATPTTGSQIAALYTDKQTTPHATFLATQSGGGSFIYSDGTTVNDTVTGGAPTSGIHLYCWKLQFGSALQFLVDGAAQTVGGASPSVNDSGAAGYQAWGNISSQNWKGDGYMIIDVAGITSAGQDAAIHTLCQGIWGVP